jgi:hypothetical protein
MELERFRQQQHQQQLWSDEHDRFERECWWCCLLQLQRCDDQWRRVFWSKLVRRVDERGVYRRVRMEFLRWYQQQHQQQLWSDDHERF